MNWSIRRKLLTSSIITLLLTLFLGSFALSRMSSLNDNTGEVGNQWLPSLEAIGQLRDGVNRLRITDMHYLTETNEEERTEIEGQVQQIRADINRAENNFESLITSPQEQTLYDQFKESYEEYNSDHGKIFSLVSTEKQREQLEAEALLIGPLLHTFNKSRSFLDDLAKMIADGGKSAVQRSMVAYTSGRSWVVGVLCIVVLLGIGFALWLAHTISRSLARVVKVAEQLASGDLSATIAASSKDEIGKLLSAMSSTVDYLKEMAAVADRIADGDLTVSVITRSEQDRFGTSLKKMAANLRASVNSIGAGSTHVAGTSAEIARASDEAKRSSRILSNASEEITATIHQMAASIQQVASNAQTQDTAAAQTSAAVIEMVASFQGMAGNTMQLARLTALAGEAAQTGQRTLLNSGQNMQRISSSVESAGEIINSLGQRAESIGKIVGTIDDIADQTNLLALNAAIEAARAGEHGLGFAVVADEVRKLAERSARSTKEISELIEAIQKESRSAVRRMEESNTTVREYISDTAVENALESVISSVERIVSFTGEIKLATSEQSARAEQVGAATQDLTQLTKEISMATEEQSTGAAEIVRAMEQLQGIIRQSAHAADELQGSAEQLYRQSDVLNAVVSGFKTGAADSQRSRLNMAAVSFEPEPAVMRFNGAKHLLN